MGEEATRSKRLAAGPQGSAVSRGPWSLRKDWDRGQSRGMVDGMGPGHMWPTLMNFK